MNLLLLQAEEISPSGIVSIDGRRAAHVRDVLRAQQGQRLRVGVKGGARGSAEIEEQSKTHVVLRVRLDLPPPVRPQIDVIAAIARPKALKRVIPALTSLGVDRILLVGAHKVEQSYFDSHVLDQDFLSSLVDLGLEQAQDTVPPTIECHRDLHKFFRERLPQLPAAARVLCHPGPSAEAIAASERLLVAVGPDGGWTDAEVQLFAEHQFRCFSLGPRTLRVEVAVPALIGALRLGPAPTRSAP